MNCIIVDDDEMSTKAMKHLVSQVQFLKLIGTCNNASEALTILNNEKIDLMLLDIEMPEMSGLELINSIKSPPITILATSKTDYALEAFDSDAIDYMVKPISLDRFYKAIARAKDQYDSLQSTIDFSGTNYVFVKNNGALVKLHITEILWIDALGDYMTINTANKKYIVHSTMKVIESKLPTDKFIRVHRSYLISIDNITAIDDNVVVIGKQLIPVGAVYKENLTKRLNLL